VSGLRNVVLLALLAIAATAHAGPGRTFVGSAEDGRLVLFDADHPEAARTVQPTGLSARLLGVDWRPADRQLYGLTTSNDIYRLDATTGTATLDLSSLEPGDYTLFCNIAGHVEAGMKTRLTISETSISSTHTGSATRRWCALRAPTRRPSSSPIPPMTATGA